jgi:hypothetical protein
MRTLSWMYEIIKIYKISKSLEMAQIIDIVNTNIDSGKMR